MKIWDYIEKLAWGVLLLTFALLLLLFYGLSGAASEPIYSWLFGDGSFMTSAVFALSRLLSAGKGCIVWIVGATILVAQMQRPLGVRRPLWFKILMAPCAVLHVALSFLPLAMCLWLLLETGRLGMFALSLGYILLLAFILFHRATRNSALGALVLLVGFAALFSGVAVPELLQLLAVPTLFLVIVGMFVTTLFFRRETCVSHDLHKLPAAGVISRS